MTNDSLKVAVLGAGRMGQQVLQVIDAATDCQVAGVWSRTTDTEFAGLLACADVAIDFTLPEVTREIAGIAAEQRVPLVCGVTGLGEEAENALAAAARHIALLVRPQHLARESPSCRHCCGKPPLRSEWTTSRDS